LAERALGLLEKGNHKTVKHHELRDFVLDIMAIGPKNVKKALVQNTFGGEAAVRITTVSGCNFVDLEHVDVVLAHDDGRGVDEAAQRVENNEVAQSRAVVVHEQAEVAVILAYLQLMQLEYQSLVFQKHRLHLFVLAFATVSVVVEFAATAATAVKIRV
jgi:hypothetical protein